MTSGIFFHLGKGVSIQRTAPIIQHTNHKPDMSEYEGEYLVYIHINEKIVNHVLLSDASQYIHLFEPNIAHERFLQVDLTSGQRLR